MNAYIYQAALLCEDCGEAVINALGGKENCPALVDSDAWPDGPYHEGGGEADTPQHCGTCGVFLDNPLTGDGENYVLDAFREYVESGRGSPDVLAEWRHAYSWTFDHYEDVSLPMLLEEQGGWKPGQEERWKRLAGS